jgi:phytoene dehydrogenase-like protein
VLYLGIDEDAVPKDFPLHHQILADGTLGEGHSIFLSLSPPWDTARAPAGQRALTASTHTRWEPWWDLRQHDPAGYAARKQTYTARMLDGIARVLPVTRDAIRLLVPGTPVSFARFTRRPFGWVGGFPQTRLGRAVPHRLARNLWLVGDSTFPGQSIAAAALGGLAVAHAILQEHGQALNMNKHAATMRNLHEEEADVIGGTLVDSTRSSAH